MRLPGRGLPWWWTVGPALGLGSIGLGLPFALGLQQGGLAPVAVAAVMAAVVVGPLAREDWLHDQNTSPTGHLEGAISQLAILGGLAALGSTFAHELREIVLLATVAILAASVGPSVVWVGVAGWMMMLAVGALTLGTAPGWSVLDPTVTTWRTWLAPALTVGAFLGGVPGGWRWFPAPAPGRTNVPFLVTGLLIAAWLSINHHLAALHEISLGGQVPVVGGLIVVMAGVTVWMKRPGSRIDRTLDVAVFTSLLAIFTTDGLAELWWTLTCPVLMATYAALNTWRTRSARWFVFTVAMIASVLMSSITPPSATVGSLLVVPWIAAVWIGGTRTLLARP